MIRLIASDIDGTLVRESSHHINPEYFEVIRALKAKGIRFCACSGRQYKSILELFKPVADDIYFIAENGAYCLTTAAHCREMIARSAEIPILELEQHGETDQRGTDGTAH